MHTPRGTGSSKEAPESHDEQWSKLIKGYLDARDEHPWFKSRESYLMMTWLIVVGPATRVELCTKLGLGLEMISDCVYKLKMYKLIETKKRKEAGRKIEEIHATERGEREVAEYNQKVTLFENSVHSQLSGELASRR